MDCGGYASNFVEDPAEIFKCIVCHLVLKNPVLLVECGHRACKGCFRQIVSHASEGNVSCPLDRIQVDVNKVVDDKGVARTIMDFKVKCDNSSLGCPWGGELRHLQKHSDDQCSLNASKKNSRLIEQLQQRVGTCESKLKKKLKKRDNEIEELKRLNRKFDARIKTLETQVVNLAEKITAQSSCSKVVSLVDSQVVAQGGGQSASNGSRITSVDKAEESDGGNESEDEVEEETDHEETCHVCNADGTLILCDTCPLSFHLACHTPALRHAPRGRWSCCECMKKRRTRKRQATTATESLLAN